MINDKYGILAEELKKLGLYRKVWDSNKIEK